MHDGTIRDIIFLEDSPSRSSLLVSGGAGTCSLYVTDCQSGQVVQALKGHSGQAPSILPNLFILQPRSSVSTPGEGRSSSPAPKIRPSASGTSALPKPSMSSSPPPADPTVSALQANSHPSPGAPVTSVCVDPSGQLLVSGHEDASVALFDLSGNRVLQTYRYTSFSSFSRILCL